MADENERPKVWHVDDSKEWLDDISRILKEVGLQVVSTDSVVKAKKMIPDPARMFTVAILDGNLPDGQGEQIAALLRENNFLTGGIIDLANGHTSWADVSLIKLDFERIEFLATVARLLTTTC